MAIIATAIGNFFINLILKPNDMEQISSHYQAPATTDGANEGAINTAPSHYDEQHPHDPSTGEDDDVSSSCEPNGEASRRAPKMTSEPVLMVRDYMKEHRLEVRFDGEFAQADAVHMALSAADIDRVLVQQEKDEDALLDEIVVRAHDQGSNVAVGSIIRAIRIVKRNDQQQRLASVMRPLLNPLSPEEYLRADQQWERFVGTAFEIDTRLGTAILKKFIHDVKSKRLNRPVKRHLMPVFQSRVQGSGKTTATLRFLSPLKELHTEPALLADFADRRSGDVYRYPVVFIDDMDKIAADLIPTLNSLVTGSGLLRRTMGGSGSRKVKQRAMLIGTCNPPVSDVIPDESGNRRFATMPFRNGEVAKGGDPAVWEVINTTDFQLLWRSVDVFGGDPIESLVPLLVAWQERYRRRDPFEEWLVSFDMESDEVRQITDKNGTRAGKLYDLFVAQTRSPMSVPTFSNEMKRMIELSRGPFGPKERDQNGCYYPRRVRP